MSYDADWYAIVETAHEVQNPVSADAIRGMGTMLGLRASSRVLDVACGTCGPAVVLARQFGCRLTCVDATHEFVVLARRRIERAGVAERIDLIEMDASRLHFPNGQTYDAAICLGASFVYGGLVPALMRLSRGAPLVAVGEPFLELDELVKRAETAGVHVTTVMVSREEDWEAYEAQRLRTLKRWLKSRPKLELSYLRREHEAQRRRKAEKRGWAIVIARTASDAGR